MISAFGVEHGESISKQVSASERKTKKDKNYRASRFQAMNRRSRTYVKHGSGARRVGIPIAAGFAGPVGESLALTRNIGSGDTRSYHRVSGRKATAKIGSGGAALNIYGHRPRG